MTNLTMILLSSLTLMYLSLMQVPERINIWVLIFSVSLGMLTFCAVIGLIDLCLQKKLGIFQSIIEKIFNIEEPEEDLKKNNPN